MPAANVSASARVRAHGHGHVDVPLLVVRRQRRAAHVHEAGVGDARLAVALLVVAALAEGRVARHAVGVVPRVIGHEVGARARRGDARQEGERREHDHSLTMHATLPRWTAFTDTMWSRRTTMSRS